MVAALAAFRVTDICSKGASIGHYYLNILNKFRITSPLWVKVGIFRELKSSLKETVLGFRKPVAIVCGLWLVIGLRVRVRVSLGGNR